MHTFSEIRFKALQIARAAKLDIARVLLTIPLDQSNIPVIFRISGYRILLSRSVLEEYELEDAAYCVLHAIFALVLQHDKRAKPFVTNEGERVLWNCCSEMVRTELLMHCGITNSSIPVLTTRGTPYEGMGVEQIFKKLFEDAKKQQQSASDFDYDNARSDDDASSASMAASFGGRHSEDDEDGEASGDAENNEDAAADDSSSEDVGDEADGESLLDSETLLDKDLRDTLRNLMQTFGRGTLSNYGEFTHFTAQKQLARIQRIRNLLRCVAGKGVGKFKRSSRPMRKHICPELIMFSYERQSFGKVAVLVDVSGSTFPYRQQVFDQLVATAIASDRIDVYLGDVDFLEIKKHQKALDLKGLIDGGGTDMATLMERIDEDERYHSLVVITDGETPWPSKPTRANAYCILVGSQCREDVPDWIQMI